MDDLTSASSFLALLEDDEPELKSFALERLNVLVDRFWPEIADFIETIEILHEDKDFPARSSAALLASKVFYHLGDLDDALNFALEAGDYFDVADTSLYTKTMISCAIDSYIAKRHQGKTDDQLDQKLVSVVNRMFSNSLTNKEFKQIVGVAIESLRLDMLERAIQDTQDTLGMLSYIFKIATTVTSTRNTKTDVLRIVAKYYQEESDPKYINLLECYIALQDAEEISVLLSSLFLDEDSRKSSIALQLCFILYNRAPQRLIKKLLKVIDDQPLPNNRNEVVGRILNGEVTSRLRVEFLSRNNNTDQQILTKVKDKIKQNSQLHNATVLSHMLMNAGTTADAFLRNNRDWLAKANNWAKFSVVASLGVIHQGHVGKAMSVLNPYLPRDGVSSSPYEIGGGLYALGLIHANHGGQIVDYMIEKVMAANAEIIQHGGSLGLGLAALASNHEVVHQQLNNILISEKAVAGEAAAIGMGLNKMGTGDVRSAMAMMDYAHETKHEKIIRGIAVGVSLIMYGRQEEADDLIQRLHDSKDHTLRTSLCHTIGMAYIGTNNNTVIKKLLHVAVSDVNDDVRRAAVTALGFILIRTPEQLPSVVALLSESFNPYVRVGSCMALAIACASTGMPEAIALIEPMLDDTESFVRQGAFIALAMIMQQQPNSHPKSQWLRDKLMSVVESRLHDSLAKFGAIVAIGILNAGGRNVATRVCRGQGHIDATSAMGLLVFTQFWFWYPLTHFISLAFTPTAVIALNKNLDMPKIQIKSASKPSQFAYPPALEGPKEKTKKKIKAAVLSVSRQATAEQETEKDEDGDEEMKDETIVEEEQDFTLLDNPARVVPDQISLINIEHDRYGLVLSDTFAEGVVILDDSKPSEPEDIIEISDAPSSTDSAKSNASAASEPSPPPSFKFDESKEQ